MRTIRSTLYLKLVNQDLDWHRDFEDKVELIAVI